MTHPNSFIKIKSCSGFLGTAYQFGGKTTKTTDGKRSRFQVVAPRRIEFGLSYLITIFQFKFLFSFYLSQKNRLSLITTGNLELDPNIGQLSGSFHSHSPRFSPQNSINNSQIIAGDCIPVTPTADSRPHTPGSNSGTLKSNTASLERNASKSVNAIQSDDRNAIKREITKTHPMDRTSDPVYTATTNVVKAIMILSQGVEKAVAIEYLDLVKNVGFELRALLASVDNLSSSFSAQAHKYI